jgi:hypothetical protein
LQKFRLLSAEILLFHPIVALQFSSIQREVLRVKQDRLLSQNQMREIVMDSDSDKEKYYASEDTEDEGEPHPQFLENADNRSSPQCEVTEVEMFAFLAQTLQTGHTVQGRLEDSWMKIEQLCCPFYGQTMVHTRYYHIL